MSITFRELGYESRINYNNLDYIFKENDSLCLEEENLGIWGLKYIDDSLFIFQRNFVRDDKVVLFIDGEKKLIAKHLGNGDFEAGEGLTYFVTLYDNVICRNEIKEFLIDALKTNKRMYSLFLFEDNFSTAVERKRRNASNHSVPVTFFQNIISSGFNSLEKVYTGCSHAFFVENLCNSDMGLANDKKKLRQVLGLPSAVIDFLKNEEFASLYSLFKQVAEEKDINDTSYLVDYMNTISEFEKVSSMYSRGSKKSFLEEVLEISLLTKTSMKNILNYLHSQAFMYGENGIGGVQLPQSEALAMRDYLAIANKYNLEVEALPSNLRAAHFYIQNNTCYAGDEDKNKKFIEAVEKYKHLEHKGKEYSIITPEDVNAMIDEGMQMHHCIANYIDMVCKGTIVLFLRKNEEPEKSFISFEVTNSGEFVQIKGKYDIDIEPQDDESAEENAVLAFLNKWRDKKFSEEEGE